MLHRFRKCIIYANYLICILLICIFQYKIHTKMGQNHYDPDYFECILIMSRYNKAKVVSLESS